MLLWQEAVRLRVELTVSSLEEIFKHLDKLEDAYR